MNPSEIVKTLGVRALTGVDPSNDVFERFLDLLENYTPDTQIHTLSEIKLLSTTFIGSVFELLCKLYLQKIIGCQSVWLLKEMPIEYKQHLGIPTNDFGIDIIAVRGNEVYAIQCKYRGIQKRNKIPTLNWKQLSTFYSLCSRSGLPCLDGSRKWNRHVVMTTCSRVVQITEKQPTDWYICRRAFKNLTYQEWSIMLDLQPNVTVIGQIEKPRTQEELREARLRALTK